MKIHFDLPPGSAQESNGMAVRYAAARRQVPRWRWLFLLALVSAPPLFFGLRFASAYWWESAPAFVTMDDVTVKAGASGRVASTRSPGERVRRGQTMGLFQSSPMVASAPAEPALVQAQPAGRAETARAALALAERQARFRLQRLETVRALLEQRAATAAELASAQAQWLSAESDRVRAKGDLAALQGVAPSRAVASSPAPAAPAQPALGLAPVDGELLRLFVRPGEWVEAETEVALMRGPAEPRITAFVEAADARYARPGRRATLRFADGGRLEAQVTKVAPEARHLPPERSSSFVPQVHSIVVELKPDAPLPQRYRIQELPLDVRFKHVWAWEEK